MVQREISGDSKQPTAQIIVPRGGDRGPADSQKDLLGQIARRLRTADRPAEVPEQAMLVRGEERFWIGHASLTPKNAARTLSSRRRGNPCLPAPPMPWRSRSA